MILLILSILIILLGFKYPSSRKITILILAFMWILYGFNDANGDYINYYYDYLKIGRGDFLSFSFSEEGYIIIAYFCSKFLHMTYQHFVILTAAVSTIMLGYVVCHFTPRPNTALVLFMLNPYWMMICQTRFYMAFLFVLVGYALLSKYEGKKGIILFFVFVIISGFFHRTGWLCIILLLSRVKSKKIIGWLMVIMAFLVTLFRTPLGMRIAGRYISDRKVEVWLAVDAHRSALGIILLILIHLAIMFTAIYLNRRLEVKNYISSQTSYLLIGVVLMMTFLPMECIDKNYERFFRFSLLFVYMLYGHFKEVYVTKLRAMPIGNIMLTGCLLSYYAFFYVSFSGWFEHNLIPILESNILIP